MCDRLYFLVTGEYADAVHAYKTAYAKWREDVFDLKKRCGADAVWMCYHTVFGFKFPSKPDGWRRTRKDEYQPKKNNKELHAAFIAIEHGPSTKDVYAVLSRGLSRLGPTSISTPSGLAILWPQFIDLSKYDRGCYVIVGAGKNDDADDIILDHDKITLVERWQVEKAISNATKTPDMRNSKLEALRKAEAALHALARLEDDNETVAWNRDIEDACDGLETAIRLLRDDLGMKNGFPREATPQWNVGTPPERPYADHLGDEILVLVTDLPEPIIGRTATTFDHAETCVRRAKAWKIIDGPSSRDVP